MGNKPKSRTPYVSSTIKPNAHASQWRKSARVAPARSFNVGGEHRALSLAVIIAIPIIAIIVCLIIFLPGVFSSIDSSNKQIRVELSESRVLSDLRTREIPAPSVTGYRYVETTNLIGPKFDSATIGEIQGSVADDDVTRTATSDAIWHNRDVTVYQKLEIQYSYDVQASSWKEGGFRTVDIVVEPIREPNAGLITDDLFTLLQEYDPALAARLAGATIKTESELTIDGGTITETLSKQDGTTVNDATVVLNVTWSDKTGWVPTIQDVQNSSATVAPSVSGAQNQQNPADPNAKNSDGQSGDNQTKESKSGAAVEDTSGRQVDVPQL